MKIAMMTNNYKPFIGGVPISVERLAEGLREKGHKVVIFAPYYEEQEREEDVVRYGVIFRRKTDGFSVPNSLDPEIERRFRQEDFDLIHVHHPMMIGDTARYLSWKYHVPLVFTYHTRYEQYLHYIGLSALKGMMPFYLKSCTKSCDVVLAPTPLMREYLEKAGVKSKVRVLPTGLLDDSFCPDREKAARLRRELAGGKKRLFCSIARLAKEKNLEFLLKSMKIFKENYGGDFRLALIGEGPRRKELEKLAGRLGLKEELIFVGTVSNREIKNYCHAADAFLFTSLSETQGIVLLESMAAGTPVIALRATGVSDVIVNGENGYMTEASEIEFAGKVMDMFEKKELEFLRQGAKKTAEEYKSGVIADKALSAYEEALIARRIKESQKRGSGNRRENMVYS
ncbi:MAG: glycosyltransferase [Clostridium sp.]|nr:glycosyltransferase [Clostridium sp.]